MVQLIHIPIWNRKVLLATGNVDLLAEVRKHKLGANLISQVKQEFDTASVACVYSCEKRGRYVLWFKSHHPRTDTVVHETNHIVRNIMRYLGARGEQEAHAYTQEWLFNEIRRLLK